MDRYLSIKDLIEGGLYRLKAKRLPAGIFRGVDSSFIGLAHRYGYQVFDLERHVDVAGTAFPLELQGICPIQNVGTPNEALRHWLMEQAEPERRERDGRRRKRQLKSHGRKA